MANAQQLRIAQISIHTLRVEGDKLTANVVHDVNIFQSTPSVWRVTTPLARTVQIRLISIHTLRVEGDSLSDV